MDIFTFDNIRGLQYGKTKVADFNLKIKRKNKTVHLPTGQISIEYLIEAERNEKKQEFYTNTLNPTSWFAYSSICTDAAISLKQKKLLHLYLQTQIQNIEEEEVIELDGMGLFSYNDTAIFCTGEEVFAENKMNIPIKINAEISKMARTYIKKTYRIELVDELMKILTLQNGISDVLFYVGMLGCMKPILNKAGYPVKFVTNIYGKSGSRKTTLAKLFGLMDAKIEFPLKFICGFNQVRKSKIQKDLKNLSGNNLLIDDFHPRESAYASSHQIEMMDFIVRQVELYPDSANVIITSEFLEGKYSLQDRQLQIYMPKCENTESLTEIQQKPWVLPQVQRYFMQRVMENYKDVLEIIKKWRNNVKIEKISIRSGEYIDILLLVEEIFCTYFWEKEELGVYREKINLKNSLNKVMSNQERHFGTFARGYEDWTLTVAEMLVAKQLKICTSKKEFKKEDETVLLDDKKIYITRNDLDFGLRKYLNKSKVNITKVVKDLHDKEILDEYDNGNEYMKKINGFRCYIICMPKLIEYATRSSAFYDQYEKLI